MRQKNLKAMVVIFILTMVLVGCSSDSDDDSNGSTDTPIENPSFAQNIQPIFTRSCSLAGCHSTADASGGLVLSSGQAYNNIVNVPSSQQPAIMRIAPSDPDNSYIIIKLEGRQTVGVQMPASGSITFTDIQNIKNWISRGAQNN